MAGHLRAPCGLWGVVHPGRIRLLRDGDRVVFSHLRQRRQDPVVSDAKRVNRPEGYPMDHTTTPACATALLRPPNAIQGPRPRVMPLRALAVAACPEKHPVGDQTRNLVTSAVDICVPSVHNLAYK